MAHVQPHDARLPGVANPQSLSGLNWPFASTATDAAEAPAACFEIHGNAYIAYCKAWAPVWIDEEEELDY